MWFSGVFYELCIDCNIPTCNEGGSTHYYRYSNRRNAHAHECFASQFFQKFSSPHTVQCVRYQTFPSFYLSSDFAGLSRSATTPRHIFSSGQDAQMQKGNGMKNSECSISSNEDQLWMLHTWLRAKEYTPRPMLQVISFSCGVQHLVAWWCLMNQPAAVRRFAITRFLDNTAGSLPNDPGWSKWRSIIWKEGITGLQKFTYVVFILMTTNRRRWHPPRRASKSLVSI